jgi:hypothetical protein
VPWVSLRSIVIGWLAEGYVVEWFKAIACVEVRHAPHAGPHSEEALLRHLEG